MTAKTLPTLVTSEFQATFLAFVAHQIDGYLGRTPKQLRARVLVELINDHVLHPKVLPAAETFFAQRGWDMSAVTSEALTDAAISVGFVINPPARSFADMLECIKQHGQGLVSDTELIGALQCTKFQMQAINDYHKLPLSVSNKLTIAAWDALVIDRHAKVTPPSFEQPKGPNVKDVSWIKPGALAYHTKIDRCVQVVGISHEVEPLHVLFKVEVSFDENRVVVNGEDLKPVVVKEIFHLDQIVWVHPSKQKGTIVEFADDTLAFGNIIVLRADGVRKNYSPLDLFSVPQEG
jgi:hypothetical protein